MSGLQVLAGACPNRKRFFTRAKAAARGSRFAEKDDYLVLIRRGAIHLKRLVHHFDNR
jgi:hypothetical protein